MAIADDLIEKLLEAVDFNNLSPDQVTGKDGLIKQLTKRIIESAMNIEMKEHLGYEKHERKSNSSNSRNGTSKKNVSTEVGNVSIDFPGDRNSEFEPRIIPKHEKRFKGFDDKIISM